MTSQNSINNKRPVSITVICIIGFLGIALSIPLIFLDTTANIASWYPPYLVASVIVGLACFIGLWKLKKWAAYGYTLFVLINQLVLLSTGLWEPLSIILPAIVVVIALANLKVMS